MDTATQAFGEISAAISAHQELGDSLKQEARSVSAYQESVRLANTRYDNELASYLEEIEVPRQEVRRELLVEAQRHDAWKLLRDAAYLTRS